MTDENVYYAQGTERPRPLSAADEAALFNAYRRRRTKAGRERLVKQFLYWAAELACRYCGPRFPKTDAISAANLGLMQAIEKFDPACGKRFVWWSFLFIRRAIVDDMRTNSYLVNPYPALNAAKYRYQKAGKTDAAAAQLKNDREAIFSSAGNTAPYDEEVSARSVPEEARANADHSAMLELIRSRLSQLNPQERKIIRLRYLGGDTMFFREIGLRLKLGEDHVRYVHDHAILKLRRSLKKEI